MVSRYWQVAIVAGKVPNFEKVPEPKLRATARCEVFASVYITYIGSDRPLWAAGESIYCVCFEEGFARLNGFFMLREKHI